MSAESPAETAMCCAQFYEQDIVRELMGDSFHPGGTALSKRLINHLDLKPGAKVLDIACGPGTTTRLLAAHGVQATGLDYSEINIARAAGEPIEQTSEPCCEPGDPCSAEQEAGQEQQSNSGGTTQFVQGSADDLPFADNHFDAAVCECAVSTFADQPRAAEQISRVLKPGGLFGMTDMVVNGDLPEDVAANIAPWTCLSHAHTVAGYQQLFVDGGFSIVRHVDESQTLLELVSELKRKLVMAGMGKALGALPDLNLDIRQMRALLGQASELVKAQVVQYGLIVFSKT